MGKPRARTFLGVSFYRNKQQTRIYVPKKSKQKLEDRIRHLTNRNRSMRMDERIKYHNYLIQGWINYFKIGTLENTLKRWMSYTPKIERVSMERVEENHNQVLQP
ncbi:group II intron maturase-specific domain-containing protein [Lysinibacillus zambalensis]|uniref:group II intron maturase-specific domain-containing protein n=1 Tax=Lysinibacillus zambalensis TaxID=3160866 RepID=UPI003D80AA8C